MLTLLANLFQRFKADVEAPNFIGSSVFKEVAHKAKFLTLQNSPAESMLVQGRCRLNR